MRIEIEDDYAALSQAAARVVSTTIKKKPTLRIGLAAGETPIGLYRELIRLHREEGLDFSQIEVFGLDEYLGVPPDHPESFSTFLHRHFLDQIDVKAGQVHLFDGSPRDDYLGYCRQNEETIRCRGGIDLQILGIGKNGHIGFNEPSSSLASRTRPVVLTAATLEDNRRLFGSVNQRPRYALTLGIETILEARRILLLASGTSKANIVAHAIEGPLTTSVPASTLQLHRAVLILLDAEAAAQLRHRDYYRRTIPVVRHAS
jgi:glucosamine-6-phosphate deaminase